MSNPRLLLFMGSECGGLYALAKTYGSMGLRCGLPFGSLRNPLTIRHMPPHGALWYWSAIRRFFEDMGLPPIAEVPEDRVSPEEREYYTRLVARCLGQSLQGGSFLCADHLTPLVLPLVLEAVEALKVRVELYFFFSHPAREVAALRRNQGQAARLSEYVWRNTAAAAIRHGGRRLHFIEADALDATAWRTVAREILEFFGPDAPQLPENFSAPCLEPLPSLDETALSPLTRQLYGALRAHARGEDWQTLEAAAQTAYAAQMEQSGWQYVDCLDCGTLDAHARRLLAQAGRTPQAGQTEPTEICSGLPPLPENQADWLALLDAAERKLLEARQDFESRLFLHSDSLHRHYMHRLEDERRLQAQAACREKENMRQRRKRHSARLRVLWKKLQTRQGAA